MAKGSRTTLDSATRFCCQPISVTLRGVVSGAAAEVEDADFSTDTARANGPLGSESCRWGCCRFVLPQLWSEDCASGVTVKPPGVPLGYVMLVASGKNVSVWA